MKYNFKAIEKKWQDAWERKKIFQVKSSGKKKFYCLEMYPYPSGSGLHMGHAFNYTVGDIYARFKRMFGFNVLYPMGYDSFGLPAENAAIKAKSHPKVFTEKAIKNYIKQQKALGLSYDWSRLLMSHDSEFYKWNQFWFLKFFEKGLAYRKKAPVNWCKKCDTVLANEQVHNGKCWRHEDTEVVEKELEQWFIKTTKYSNELLKNVESLKWPEKIKLMQKNWIGKSEGTEIDFEVNSKISNVVIVHGSPIKDRTKEENYVPDNNKAWIGWIKKELAKKKIKCDSPQMPTPWNPKYSEWKKEFEKIPVDENSIFIGHSAGGAFLVRWLGETKKKIKKLILISPGKAGMTTRLQNLYGAKTPQIKNLVKDKIIIYTSEDDHDYHIKGAEGYAKEFDAQFVKLGEGYGHFTSTTLVSKEFLELLKEIIPTWPIFTTRSDTIYGATFMVVSAKHSELESLVTDKQKKEVEEFLKKSKKMDEKDLEKEGVFSGSYAINPINNEKVPIWIGNFVIADYGSGMVMGVPAHDKRDKDFAEKYNLEVKQVLKLENGKSFVYDDVDKYNVKGEIINSGKFNGLSIIEGRKKIIADLEKDKLAKKTTQYKFRDWLVSRQRYWGTPIPIIYCDKCGVVPVPEKDLPVKLPEKVKFGKGNPLATNKNFVNVKCPKCKSNAKRETDTMDTFFDSSWYYLRYCDNKNKKSPFDKKKIDSWMPVNQYIGGAEHACMHLIYARFFTKALRDLKYLKFGEPFLKLFNQGMVHAEDGERMSKSRGNVINPEDVIKKHSADILRLFVVSVASPEKNLIWSSKGIEGSSRFVKKVFDYKPKFGKSSAKLESKLNQTIRDISKDIEDFKYNFAVIKLRSLFDCFSEEKKVAKKDYESFLKIFSLFCPHIAEELWSKIKNKKFISLEKFPVPNLKKIDKKFEEQEKAHEKLISDIFSILKIVESRGEEKNKIIIYVLPSELNLYDEKYLVNRLGKFVKIFSVNDKEKFDPENKSKKVKPGRPGIYLE